MIVTSTSVLRNRRASRRAHSKPVNPLPTTTTDVTMSMLPPRGSSSCGAELLQLGQIADRLTNVRLDDPGHQASQRPVEQTTTEVGGQMEGGPRMIVGHLHGNGDRYAAAPTTGQLDGFRLVVLRDSPVDDVAEPLHLDQRRDAG